MPNRAELDRMTDLEDQIRDKLGGGTGGNLEDVPGTSLAEGNTAVPDGV